jgi:hypothetical protein
MEKIYDRNNPPAWLPIGALRGPDGKIHYTESRTVSVQDTKDISFDINALKGVVVGQEEAVRKIIGLYLGGVDEQ